MPDTRNSGAQLHLVNDEDDLLPPGHDWTALEFEGEKYLFIRHDSATREVLIEAAAGLWRLFR